jgi:hypothetical protein
LGFYCSDVIVVVVIVIVVVISCVFRSSIRPTPNRAHFEISDTCPRTLSPHYSRESMAVWSNDTIVTVFTKQRSMFHQTKNKRIQRQNDGRVVGERGFPS